MKIVNLIKALYTNTCNCMLADGTTSDWFQVNCGVRQGCRIAVSYTHLTLPTKRIV